MRLFSKNLFFAIALLAITQGCDKEPIGPKDIGVPILLNATENATKALLEEGAFYTSGNQVQIFDYYTNSGSSGYHIGIDNNVPNEYIVSQGLGNSTWPFALKRYHWTADGVHKFFGWLKEDANMTSTEDAAANSPSEFFVNGFEFDPSSQTLDISAISIQQNTKQFDFMYSDIYERNLNSDPDYVSAVPLNFSHLFTAFKITAENRTSNKIVLRSVVVTNLKDSKSATISFSPSKGSTGSTSASVVYSVGNTSGDTFSYELSNGQILKDQSIDVDDYKIMWPQTDVDLDAAFVKIVYDCIDGESSQTYNKEIYLSSLSAWNAGKKYNLNLVFNDKEIILECEVQPWEVVEQTLDFLNEITVTSKLVWDPNTVQSVNYETGEVILFDDPDIQAVGRFKIETPKGATWTASLIPIEGHQDAFAFVKETKYGAVGTNSELKVAVTNNAPIAPRHKCRLIITVQTADGRTIVVKNLVPEGKTYDFTIVQNLING